jgi:glutamine kinase
MLSFSNKAQTLLTISTVTTKSKVLPQLCFSINELCTAPERIKELVTSRFSEPLIVRSSALSEDSLLDSQAGRYLSIPNVLPSEIIPAMQRVRDSFTDGSLDDLILIQPMLTSIAMSGVVFTIDPSTGGNYIVINYDRSGSTDSVTSGLGRFTQLYYLFHGHRSDIVEIAQLCAAANELIALFDNNALDIEFAFDEAGDLYILQVRPIANSKALADYTDQARCLGEVRDFLARDRRSVTHVKGCRTAYSVMSDWNPAEMIGTRPKQLSASLYRRLITDQVWAQQRYDYGYRDVRGLPLMVDLCGMPYVDTRASFNSFIPREIGDALAAKLVDHYVNALVLQPAKHDKVEFEIIYSCYTFDLPEKIEGLAASGFSRAECESLMSALKSLTNQVIDTDNGPWVESRCAVDELERRRRQLMASDADVISKLHWLLVDCARLGTLPFAGLARCDFIGTQLLNSLVTSGILSPADREMFLRQLQMVSIAMTGDQSTLTDREFMAKYGHLRPGTYDITSPRYVDSLKRFTFDSDGSPRDAGLAPQVFVLSSDQSTRISREMERHGLRGDATSLFRFIEAGIEGRENAKFIFTRTLSDILELMAALGAAHGLDRDQMSFVDISVIDELYSGAQKPKEVLERSAHTGMLAHDRALALTLPPLITGPDDIYAFHLPPAEPNFVTLGSVIGEVCIDPIDAAQAADKIVMIPAADPGFDWIFLHGIRGFITAYGGANSHMAIRAMQLGIPAVIGAGERRFATWANAKALHIDCANRKVDIIQ